MNLSNTEHSRPVVIDRICREGDIVHLEPSGSPRMGSLIPDLALAVTSGDCWLGFDIPTAREVLILDNETDLTTAQREMGRARGHRPDAPWPKTAIYDRKPKTDWTLENLESMTPPKGLVIVNSFWRFELFGADINAIEAIARRTLATFLLVNIERLPVFASRIHFRRFSADKPTILSVSSNAAGQSWGVSK